MFVLVTTAKALRNEICSKLHLKPPPQRGKTPPKKKQKKKQTEYKINLDFDVIYTKHILKNNLSFLSTK